MATLSHSAGQGSAIEDSMTKKKDFQFMPSQGFATNFSQLIAQSDRKPSKIHKSKSKKRINGFQETREVLSQNFGDQVPSAQKEYFQSKDVLGAQDQYDTFLEDTNYQPTSLPTQIGRIHNDPWPEPHESNANIIDLENISMDEDSSGEMEVSSGSEASIAPVNYDLDIQMIQSPQHTNHGHHMSERREITDQSDNMDCSSGPDAEDSADDSTSVSPQGSPAMFNESAASSHTSALLSNDLRTSVDDVEHGERTVKLSTPVSDGSSQLTPAASVTPGFLQSSASTKRSNAAPKSRFHRSKKVNFQPPISKPRIPEGVKKDIVAQQGIHAAYASRLKPFELHPLEYQFLREHICHSHVTAYLNIRNRILRLWVRNPLVQVTQEEAIGCVQSSRWTDLAKVAYEWLVRKGYINFGCVEIPGPSDSKTRKKLAKKTKRKTIAIIGAGMAGLGCARQLEGLIQHYQSKWSATGEEPPQVVLLEGRNRIGGRLYSHPLKEQNTQVIPSDKRCTAEMGAHIIIGFDHGNPLNMIVRGQLALHHHMLKNAMQLYDVDGSPVNEKRDRMIEELYNDVLERAGQYRHRIPPPRNVQGDEIMIRMGRDPQSKSGPSIAQNEADDPELLKTSVSTEKESVPAGIDKPTGKAYMVTGSREKKRPADVAAKIGWHISEDVLAYDDLNLDAVAKSAADPTLGAAMDEAVKQYQFLLDLTPQDFRLMNWHYANLEYANAANVDKLSLGGWDQDTGNEFKGGHAQVVGGYQQVPRALLNLPTKLDIRTRKIVKRIEYNVWSGNSKTAGAKIQCEDGDTIEADYVVLTSSLGVLKDNGIVFSPAFPDWKLGAIQRLGFGLLNKVILVYKEPFWDVEQDMFGLLREPKVTDSLDQEDYSADRGRFYFFWNCVKTSGRPVLISLMAGDAAVDAESTPDAALIAEATQQLRKVFKDKNVPLPEEAVVTRWGKDKFARGTYSYVGPESIPGDYDTMATRVGNLYFAGEATCATHPATVHGAYISGLRAASEIIEDLLGPIEVPKPLVGQLVNVRADQAPRESLSRHNSSQHQATKEEHLVESEFARKARLDKFETEIILAIHADIGPCPIPENTGKPSGHVLFKRQFRKDLKVDANDGSTKVDARANAAWATLSESEKQPWNEKAKQEKAESEMKKLTFQSRLIEWNDNATAVRRKYVQDHPGVLSKAEELEMWANLESNNNISGERKAKRDSGYAQVREDSMMM